MVEGAEEEARRGQGGGVVSPTRWTDSHLVVVASAYEGEGVILGEPRAGRDFLIGSVRKQISA